MMYQNMKKKRKRLGLLFLFLLVMAVSGTFAGQINAQAKTASGTAVKKGWNSKHTAYYKNGKKVKGLQTIGKKSYYFSSKGALVKNRRAFAIKVKGKKCYFNIDKKGVAKQWKGTAAYAAKQLVSLKANLNKVTDKNLDKSLEKAFFWASSLTYRENTKDSLSGKKAAEYYGNYAFLMKCGDCNTQAYAFYWMAKVLGYEPKFIKGLVPTEAEGFQPHAWVEIVFDGTTYVFDPNFNNTFRDMFGKYCGYKIRYGAKQTYQYFNLNKVRL